jgi:hypothetical protein
LQVDAEREREREREGVEETSAMNEGDSVERKVMDC